MSIYIKSFLKIKQQVRYFINHLKQRNAITEQALLCNKLLSKLPKPTSYLEIGVDQGKTFKRINSEIKHGVDPYGTFNVNYRMTSEMFFALNETFFRNKYDVIFIDSAHFSFIVNSEIKNALKILKPGGYIVLHDTDPLSKETSELILKDMLAYLKQLAYPYKKSHQDSLVWKACNGDVWKSIAKIRMENPDLEVFTIENFCCSVIKKYKQKNMMKTVPFKKLNWNFFVKHRKEILNLINFDSLEKYM